MKIYKKQRSLLLSFFLLVSSISILHAQQDDSIKTFTLKESVISASRFEQDPDDVGRSISIIDQISIQQSMPLSVGELLEKEAGIQFVGSGQNPGATQRMFVRGANSYQLIVMIDGIKISDPSSVDNGLDLAELSLENIERIEIIRGSHSSMYGSSAIGGVVNIMTKKNSISPVMVNLSTTAGKFGEGTFLSKSIVNLNYNHKSGLYFTGGVDYEWVNGLDATIDTLTNPTVFKNRDQDGFDKLNYSAKLGYRKNKWDAHLNYRNTNLRADLDKSSFTDDDNRYIEFNRSLLDYGISYKANEKLNIHFQGGYTQMDRMDLDDSSVMDAAGNYDHQYARTEFNGMLMNHELLLKLNLKKVKLLAGTDFSSERMNNSGYIFSWSPWFGVYENTYDLDSLQMNTSIISEFAHVELRGDLIHSILKPLNLAAGVRLSRHSTFGNVLTWELNPSWKLNAYSLLYFSWSTGFNAPSLYRLYSPDVAWGAQVSRGNPNLKPEYSKSLEFGVKQRISKTTHYTVSFFSNHLKDVIEYVYLWDKSIGVDTLGNDWMRNDYRGDTYVNLSEQNVYGVEFYISSKISKKFNFTGSYTFINASTPLSALNIDTAYTNNYHVQLFESGLFLQNKENIKIGLVRRPSSIVNLSLNWTPTSRIFLNLNTKFVGTRYDSYYNPSLGPYGAMDNELLAGYALTKLLIRYEVLKSLSLGLKIENLFDTDYMEINGFSTRGRGFFMNVNYNFRK